MKLIETPTGFRELVETYDVYGAPVVLTSASHIPENATVEIKHSGDYYTVTVYRHHAYNAEVLAALNKQREAIISLRNSL